MEEFIMEKKCDLCNNPAMHLHSKCHITAPLRAEIEGNILTLFCYLPDCNRKIASFTIESLNTNTIKIN